MVTRGLPFNHLRKWSTAAKQALRWQTLAPTGISAINWISAPSTEEPQLTSKAVFLAVKPERFDESGLVALAAWITCDLSLDHQKRWTYWMGFGFLRGGAGIGWWCCRWIVFIWIWKRSLWCSRCYWFLTDLFGFSFGGSICISCKSEGAKGGA